MTITIRDVDWRSVPAAEQGLFSAAIKQRLSVDKKIPTLILGAYDSDVGLCGIAVVTHLEATRQMDVEYLNVLDAFSYYDIAKDLVTEAEKRARASGCVMIFFIYSSTIPKRNQVEEYLKQSQWQPPAVLLHRYFYDSYLFHAPWLEKPRLLPSEFSLHSWDDLTEVERHRMQVLVSQGAYPYSVYPYGKGKEPEPINSIFLRLGDRVVAWQATHREDRETIIYSGLYVHTDQRGRGLSIYLLAESIRRQQASPVRMACFELNESQVSNMWARFIRENVAPQALKREDLFTTWKDLR